MTKPFGKATKVTATMASTTNLTDSTSVATQVLAYKICWVMSAGIQ